MTEEIVELNAVFHGRVQGVFFRATIENYAKERTIVGFVENISDGTVRMVAQSTKQNLEDFLEHIKCHPGEAAISRVDLNYCKISAPYKNFLIKR